MADIFDFWPIYRYNVRNKCKNGRKMGKSDRKLAVIWALKHYGKPVAMSELLVRLDGSYSERTVRRWLNELEKEGEVIKTGSKKGARYQAANLEPLADESIEEHAVFDRQNETAVDYIKQPIYLRKPTTYQKAFLDDYQPNTSFYLTPKQRAELKERGSRSYNHEVAGTYARHIHNRLLIDLSYNSSRLEGNTYSLLETEKLVLEDITAVGKSSDEKIMISNHKEAIRYLIEHAAELNITEEKICTLHYLLADGLLPAEQAGNYRNSAVKIGGSTYLPLSSAAKIKTIMEKICEKANAIRDPFEQSFFLLTHIAYLQAFEDCNKRTSRLSANIPLVGQNLVPLSFNDISKEDYSTAIISIYELNDVKPLADLYSFSYLRTCDLYGVNVEAMGIDKIRVTYRAQRREIIGHIVADLLLGEAMEAYIVEQSKALIPEIDQPAFQEVILEDLKLLDPSRIAGMKITVAQLRRWQQARSS